MNRVMNDLALVVCSFVLCSYLIYFNEMEVCEKNEQTNTAGIDRRIPLWRR